jgi:hypothetical protein
MIVPGSCFMPFLTASAPVPGVDCDPYWDQVVLAMHMDGANNSTTFTDEKGHTFTAVSDAQISTAQSQFGGASALFDGNDYLTTPYSADFNIGTNDFTIEAWIYRTVAVDSSRAILSSITSSSDSWNTRFNLSKDVSFDHLQFNVWSSDGTQYFLRSTSPLPAIEWVHVAVTRTSNTYRLYVDGVMVDEDSTIPSISLTNTGILVGMTYPGQPGFVGHIDDVRITNGVARTITVPTQEFLEVSC